MKFPSYKFSATYVMDGKPPDGWERAKVDGEPDRQQSLSFWNDVAYETEPDKATLLLQGLKFWDAAKVRVHPERSYGPEGTLMIGNPSDVEIKITGPFWETWVQGWFSHWTFAKGRTDAELLSSFASFVDRVRRRPDYNDGMLMGAEDIWRWKGEGTDAPCRCETCTKLGIVRIDH